MARRADQPRTQLADLLGDKPGWRLEPRTTPGASPLWCYVDAGRIELSVTAERDGIHLFVLDDDRELVFSSANGLQAWLRAHKGESLDEAQPRQAGKDRFRKLFDWG
jgi:hypothetical protein